MRGSRNFRKGGGDPGQSDNKSSSTFFYFFLFFLVLSLFYRSQMVNLKKTIIFKVPEAVQHFQGGGVQLFFRGGGSNCLFPIETHITCDFPRGGGSGPPVPPLDPHLHL